MIQMETKVFKRIIEEAKLKAIKLMVELMKQTSRFAGFTDDYLRRVAEHQYERNSAAETLTP